MHALTSRFDPSPFAWCKSQRSLNADIMCSLSSECLYRITMRTRRQSLPKHFIFELQPAPSFSRSLLLLHLTPHFILLMAPPGPPPPPPPLLNGRNGRE